MDQAFKTNIFEIVKSQKARSETLHSKYYSFFGQYKKRMFARIISFRLLFTPFVLVKNDYPYDLILNQLQNAEHYILFYRGIQPSIDLVQHSLVFTHRSKKVELDYISDYTLWENPVNLKSIKNLPHFQIIIEKLI